MATAGLMASAMGCGEPEPTPVQSTEILQTCTGHKDKQVTSDYIGAREDIQSVPSVNDVGHASAVELIDSDPSPGNEKFAVAWVRASDKKVFFRVYDLLTQTFAAPEAALHHAWLSTMGWVQSLGFDDNCLASTGQATMAPDCA